MATLFASGCMQLGPKTIAPAQFSYNRAIVSSWNQQLLLNLVRLRYRDTPMFLDVSSVVTSFSVTASASASHGFGWGGGGNEEINGSSGLSYNERPTISYRPLTGDAFTQRLLTPLTPGTLVLLANSGFGIERVLMSCVEEINGVGNAPAVPGSIPVNTDEFERFRSVAKSLENLQRTGGLEVQLDVANTKEFVINLDVHESSRGQLMQFLEAFDYPTNSTQLKISRHRTNRGTNEVSIAGRSLMAMMSFLAQGVDVPAEHQKAGLVSTLKKDNGMVAHPDEWMQDLIKIRTSKTPPSRSFVSTRHRGYYYYISDADLESKSTFALLSLLFSLQASSDARQGTPLITIPAN